MSQTGYLGLILAVAVVTYLTRIAGFLIGHRKLPDRINRFLTYVPVAVFAALVTTNLNIGHADMAPRLIGVAVASVVVLRFRQLWIGLATGLASYWLACALLGLPPS